MDYNFVFYYSLAEMNIKQIFSDIDTEYIRDIGEKGIFGKLVKFKNTSLNTIIKDIDKVKNKIRMNGANKYEIKCIDLSSIKNVYIILPV